MSKRAVILAGGRGERDARGRIRIKVVVRVKGVHRRDEGLVRLRQRGGVLVGV